MIRHLLVAFTALATLAASAATPASAASDPPRPRLKAEAVVTGDIVHIGDLVANAGIIANVPIFRAPDLGSTGMVPAQAVVQAVRAHQLIGLDTGGIQSVEVTRASRTIAPKTIEDRVAKALAARFALGKPADIALNFDRSLHPLYVEPDATGEPQVTHIDYDERNGRFYATLEIPDGPSGKKPLHLAGQATPMEQVAVLARSVAHSAVIKDEDIMMERRPRGQVAHDAITDGARAIGLAARTDLQAGEPLRAAELMKPQLVGRNEPVTLVYQVPGITLTVRGKAAEGGARGDVIAVINEDSKRTLRGVVTGPGRVVVNKRMRLIAENSAPAAAYTVGKAR
jgi:flagella basal body P-ring formation protein FlgA